MSNPIAYKYVEIEVIIWMITEWNVGNRNENS
jgi:hypothetical protein